jgi:general secretion pathway protein C
MTGLSLSPRQTRTALDLLTAAMVISVAFALAGLTWRIAGHVDTGAITVPSGNSAPAASANVSPVIALAPFGKASGSEASQPTALPLTLQGVVAADPASMSTAFIAVTGQPAAPFHIGQNINGATIAGILRDRVILNNNGRTEYLTFPDPNATPAPGAAPGQTTTVALQPGGRSLNGPPQPLPSAPQQNPPPQIASTGPGTAALLQRFNATPAAGGYRIGNAGVPGLVAGDILMSVNGTALSDPNAAGAAFTAAQSSGSATIQVIRDGKRLTLTVPLR